MIAVHRRDLPRATSRWLAVNAMEKVNGAAAGDSPSQFAADVIETYKAAMEKLPRRADLDQDVRKVAFGLVALRQVINELLPKFAADPDMYRLPSSGLVDAAAILDALTSGADHPIWKHIEGLQSGAYRPGRAPKVETERRRQAIAGGLVLALRKSGYPSDRGAAKLIISEIKSQDFSFTEDQVRKWKDHPEAPEYAEKIIKISRTVPGEKNEIERIMTAGRTEIFKWWSAPV
jgi:hypothetical protein